MYPGGKRSTGSLKRQNIDYRFQLSRDVLTTLNRGDCAAVVGVGSCGKSRLLLHLSRPDTMEYHLGDAAYTHFIVVVQANGFLNETAWAVYEGMARALMEMIDASNTPVLAAARTDLAELHPAVVADRDLAMRHLDTGLAYLFRGGEIKITFCIDEFDFVFEKFDAQLFRNLRAVRNRYKYQLTYLVATRRQMPYQRAPESWPDVEEFYELFTDNTYAIGPYDAKDATDMSVELENRMEFPLHPKTRELLLAVSGGHPGLIGSTFRAMQTANVQPALMQQMLQIAINEANWKESRKIWESLRTEERAALRRLASQGRAGRDDANILAELKAKGLVRDAGPRGALAIFSPVFHEYVRQLTSDE